MVPERFEELLSCIVVALEPSFISQSAIVAPRAEAVPKDAPTSSNSTAVTRVQRRRPDNACLRNPMPQGTTYPGGSRITGGGSVPDELYELPYVRSSALGRRL